MFLVAILSRQNHLSIAVSSWLHILWSTLTAITRPMRSAGQHCGLWLFLRSCNWQRNKWKRSVEVCLLSYLIYSPLRSIPTNSAVRCDPDCVHHYLGFDETLTSAYELELMKVTPGGTSTHFISHVVFSLWLNAESHKLVCHDITRCTCCNR